MSYYLKSKVFNLTRIKRTRTINQNIRKLTFGTCKVSCFLYKTQISMLTRNFIRTKLVQRKNLKCHNSIHSLFRNKTDTKVYIKLAHIKLQIKLIETKNYLKSRVLSTC